MDGNKRVVAHRKRRAVCAWHVQAQEGAGEEMLEQLVSMHGLCRMVYVSPAELASLEHDEWYWDKYWECWFESDAALRRRHTENRARGLTNAAIVGKLIEWKE